MGSVIAPTLKLGIALLSGGNAAVQQVQSEDCKAVHSKLKSLLEAAWKPYFIYNTLCSIPSKEFVTPDPVEMLLGVYFDKDWDNITCLFLRKCWFTWERGETSASFRAWLDSCCHAGEWLQKQEKKRKKSVRFDKTPQTCSRVCALSCFQRSGSECIWEAEQSRRIRHGHGWELRYCIHMEIQKKNTFLQGRVIACSQAWDSILGYLCTLSLYLYVLLFACLRHWPPSLHDPFSPSR